MAVGKGSLSRAAKTAGRPAKAKAEQAAPVEAAPAAPEKKAAGRKPSGTKKTPKKTAVTETAASKQAAENASAASVDQTVQNVSTVMVPDPQVEKVISHIKCDLPIYLL